MSYTAVGISHSEKDGNRPTMISDGSGDLPQLFPVKTSDQPIYQKQQGIDLKQVPCSSNKSDGCPAVVSSFDLGTLSAETAGYFSSHEASNLEQLPLVRSTPPIYSHHSTEAAPPFWHHSIENLLFSESACIRPIAVTEPCETVASTSSASKLIDGLSSPNDEPRTSDQGISSHHSGYPNSQYASHPSTTSSLLNGDFPVVDSSFTPTLSAYQFPSQSCNLSIYRNNSLYVTANREARALKHGAPFDGCRSQSIPSPPNRHLSVAAPRMSTGAPQGPSAARRRINTRSSFIAKKNRATGLSNQALDEEQTLTRKDGSRETESGDWDGEENKQGVSMLKGEPSMALDPSMDPFQSPSFLPVVDGQTGTNSFIAAMASIVSNLSAASAAACASSTSIVPPSLNVPSAFSANSNNPYLPHGLPNLQFALNTGGIEPQVEQMFLDRFPWILEQLSQSAMESGGAYGFGAALPFLPSSIPASLPPPSAILNSITSSPATLSETTQRSGLAKAESIRSCSDDGRSTSEAASFNPLSSENPYDACHVAFAHPTSPCDAIFAPSSCEAVNFKTRVGTKSVEAVVEKLLRDRNLDDLRHHSHSDQLQATTQVVDGLDTPNDIIGYPSRRPPTTGDDKRGVNRRCSLNRADECKSVDSVGITTDHSAGPGTSPSFTKRRRKPDEPEESLIRYPLTLGWTRKTHVRLVTKNGVRGDVIYYSPDGRKLKSFQEIDRFLLRSEPSELTRQHFTFSSKLLVGTFVQHHRDELGNIVSTDISESDIIDQIRKINPDFQKVFQPPAASLNSAAVKPSGTEDLRHNSASGGHFASIRQTRTSCEASSMADDYSTPVDITSSKQPISDFRASFPAHTMEEADDAKRITVSEILQMSARRNQELFAMGRKRSNISFADSAKSSDASRALGRTELCHKPKRQSSRRIFQGVGLLRQRRQRMIDAVITAEMKNSIEDMMQVDLTPLPEFEELQGLTISPSAFVDCLVALEFVHSFAKTLHISRRDIPQLDSLQQCLHQMDVVERTRANCCAFYRLLRLLFQHNISSGSGQHAKKTHFIAGKKFTDTSLNASRIDEPLRLFLADRHHELSDALSTQSVFELNANLKAELLAFLCNELLNTRPIADCIEQNVAKLACLRRQKWEIECRIRKLRSDVGKAELDRINCEGDVLITLPLDGSHAVASAAGCLDDRSTIAGDGRESCLVDCPDSGPDENADDVASVKDISMSAKASFHGTRTTNSASETRGVDADASIGSPNSSKGSRAKDRESRSKSNDEHAAGSAVDTGANHGQVDFITDLEQQIVCLQNECERIKESINQRCSLMRNPQLGQDRYGRRYWFLERLGAIYVEGTDVCCFSPHHQPSSLGDQLSACPGAAADGTSDNGGSKETGGVLNPACKTEDELSCLEELSAYLIDRYQKGNASTCTDEACSQDLSEEPLNLAVPRSIRQWIGKVPDAICKIVQSKSELEKPFRQVDWTAMVDGEGTSKESNKFTRYATEEIELTEKEALAVARSRLQFGNAQPVPPKYQSGWWGIWDAHTLRKLLLSLSKRGIRERGLYRALTKIIDQVEQSFRNRGSTRAGVPPSPPVEMDWVDVPQSSESLPGAEKKSSAESAGPSDGGAQSANATTRSTHLDIVALLENIYAFEDRIIASSLQVAGNCPEPPRVALSKKISHDDGMLIANKRVLALEQMIEHRYIKEPFVSPGFDTYRLNKGSNADRQQLTRELMEWRKAVAESNDTTCLSKLLTELDKHIYWDKSIMRVSCQICNRDDNEERLLLCDACDRGHHTYCFKPAITEIPEGDWFCIDCLAKSENERKCFICGSCSLDRPSTGLDVDVLLDCQGCGKHFHLQCHEQAFLKGSQCLCLVCHASTVRPIQSSKKPKAANLKRSFDSADCDDKPPDKQDALTDDRQYDKDDHRDDYSKPPVAKKSLLSVGTVVSCEIESKDPLEERHTQNELDNDDKCSESKKMRFCDSPLADHSEAHLISQKCKDLTDELMTHQSSWPFREPVDGNIYPEYYELVDKPMDLQEIRMKAANEQYSALNDFISDVRLIFANCLFFNEDDSLVGKAGVEMNKFFDKRISEIFLSSGLFDGSSVLTK